MEGSWHSKKRVASGENHPALSEISGTYEGDNDYIGEAYYDASTGEIDANWRDEVMEIGQDDNFKTTFMVDYCKRSVTKCKRCKKSIPQGELRIGRSAKLKAKTIFQYFHVNCAFETFKKARSAANTITCMDDILGFELIKDEERVYILRLMDEVNAKRKASTIQSKKIHSQKKKVLPPSKMRTAKLAPSGLPTISILFTNADTLNQGKMSELQQRIITEKPLIVAISEVKPKNSSKEITLQKPKD